MVQWGSAQQCCKERISLCSPGHCLLLQGHAHRSDDDSAKHPPHPRLLLPTLAALVPSKPSTHFCCSALALISAISRCSAAGSVTRSGPPLAPGRASRRRLISSLRSAMSVFPLLRRVSGGGGVCDSLERGATATAAAEGQWAVGRRPTPTTCLSSMAWWSISEESWGPRGGRQARPAAPCGPAAPSAPGRPLKTHQRRLQGSVRSNSLEHAGRAPPCSPRRGSAAKGFATPRSLHRISQCAPLFPNRAHRAAVSRPGRQAQSQALLSPASVQHKQQQSIRVAAATGGIPWRTAAAAAAAAGATRADRARSLNTP